MKIIRSWLIIIICSIFLLMLLSIFVLIGYQHITGTNTSWTATNKELVLGGISMLACIGMSIFGLVHGVRSIRKKPVRIFVQFPEPFEITASGKIDFAAYRKVVLTTTFRKPAYIYISFLAFMYMMVFLASDKTLLSSQNSVPLIIVFIFLTMPFLAIFQVNQSRKKNRLFIEELQYTLNNEHIQLKGETIDATLSWQHFIEAKETKQFFFLYQNKTIATIVEKKHVQ